MQHKRMNQYSKNHHDDDTTTTNKVFIYRQKQIVASELKDPI